MTRVPRHATEGPKSVFDPMQCGAVVHIYYHTVLVGLLLEHFSIRPTEVEIGSTWTPTYRRQEARTVYRSVGASP